ncbi:hypothetical protein FA13DRAFT_1815209 [Coprinellus micaceus]|uniref:Aminoglycoside phosphotransferase domain-containing protein n=1 Tax=Coprinellus micaceus TaxID=71717 RepID=A0A4Y7T652_COPMI|nr:hypothetical protein FA13DRAFT_1815209 [Coprinellus micaceus]
MLPVELELARQLGSFLAQFHHASKSIPAETVRRLAPLSTVVNGGIHEYLVKLTRNTLSKLQGVTEEEKEEIAGRVERSLRDDTGESSGGCLGMVDFWPGSVIVSADWRTCGLIDWEYFGRSNEGSELGMFLAHFHIATLKPDISPEAAERLGNFISIMCEAYCQAAPSVVASPGFKKRLLMSYGREMITGARVSRPSSARTASRVLRSWAEKMGKDG